MATEMKNKPERNPNEQRLRVLFEPFRQEWRNDNNGEAARGTTVQARKYHDDKKSETGRDRGHASVEILFGLGLRKQMGTKNNPGEFDCYENADPDEPMFILLARDVQAPALIRQWAHQRRRNNEDPAKVQEAFDCADAMETWREQVLKETNG